MSRSLVVRPARIVPTSVAPEGALPLVDEGSAWPATPFAARLAAASPVALPASARAVVLAGDAVTPENVKRYAGEGRSVVVEASVAVARDAVKAGAVGVLPVNAVRAGERKIVERPAPPSSVAAVQRGGSGADAETPTRGAASADLRSLRVPPAETPKGPDGTSPLAESVAIVGIAGIFPEAPDAKAFWELVLSGRSTITEVPADRWNAANHWSPDASAPDKTYTKIGAFVRDFRFDPMRFRIPPSVASHIDPAQQWALTCAFEALKDAGYAPREQDAKEGLKPFDRSRAAVVLGNALGGEYKDLTAFRVRWNDTRAALERALAHLPADQRKAAIDAAEREAKADLPTITEDSMPGELSNVIAGRITNVLNLGGKNSTIDAACASTLAALDTAVRTLVSGEADLVLTGGSDRSMDPIGYVKFSKIGALSPDGSRPFDAGANGFVMGEGCGIFVMKRLADALRDGDRVYAVVRGIGASSDGKGKGITAPNPEGQKLAVKRAFAHAEVEPRHVQLVEAHGTSTPVGDVVEVEALAHTWGDSVPPGSVALGSVKSQIGHLKSAAAAAGLMKAVLALHHKTIPPSANFRTPNPAIAWGKVPFRVPTRAEPWPKPATGGPRRAGVSSFGFGGTNFHVIVEEFDPAYHRLLLDAAETERGAAGVRAADAAELKEFRAHRDAPRAATAAPLATPVLLVSGPDEAACAAALEALSPPARADAAWCAAHARPGGAVRLAVALPPSVDAAQRVRDVAVMVRDPAKRKALAMKGAFLGRGAKDGKVAFLFPGQGSQYADMLKDMRAAFPVVDATFREADEVLMPYLGKRLTDVLHDEEALKETSITQPAMLAADVALLRLLGEHAVRPDVVAGHSLGEYAALVAAGVLSFPDALIAVSARGKEMADVNADDLGGMAGVAAPPDVVDEILRTIDGYVVSANKNSPKQTVIAGSTPAVEKAMEACAARGLDVMPLPVSAAFHSAIVAPASAPLRRVLARLGVNAPRVPVIANVDAEPYPADRERILDILSKQVASPVEWVKTMQRLHADGVKVFVEVGPKRALTGFVEANLGDKAEAVLTNHPKKGGVEAWTEAVARLAALGVVQVSTAPAGPQPADAGTVSPMTTNTGGNPYTGFPPGPPPQDSRIAARVAQLGLVLDDVVVSGASLGLPGRAHRVFDDANFERMFRGESGIDRLSHREEQALVDKRITRLVKDGGEPRFEAISTLKQVIHLAGRRGAFDLAGDFGLSKEFCDGLDITAKLAAGAAIDALRDAGIPLVREDVVTKGGHRLPGQWVLPRDMRDGTGIVLASAFPGVENLVDEVSRYFAAKFGGETYHELEAVYHEALDAVKDPDAKRRLTRWFGEHGAKLRAEHPDRYEFNRKFLFEILSIGHAEVAELLRARGPNTQVNAACASMTQAVAVAEDWIRTGRARRVIVLGADDVTSDTLFPWIGAGFLAAGAATTADVVSEAALPFDRRRHGMILGMGAAGMVVETAPDVAARGMVPVAKLLASRISNSAYHGSRLDGEHISGEFEALVQQMERVTGLDRGAIAEKTLFISHETYTPARGGSASAEIAALRRGFGAHADRVLITNVKGFTGHPMGAGIEDPIAVKALQYGKLPPIANLKEPDPELGPLNLSRGGTHDRRFAVRFSAGFGSQLAILAFEQVAKGDVRIVDPAKHQAWLASLGGGTLKVEHRTLKLVGGNVAPRGHAAPVRTMTPQSAALPAPAHAPAPPAMPQPTPAVAAPAASASSAPSAMPPGGVLPKLVALVAEKTGYPADALDPSLDLEADLGIDTVKQAELFGEVRATYALPRDDAFKLKDHNTLAKMAEYVEARLGGSATTAPAPSTPPAPAMPAAAAPPPVVAAPAPAPAATTAPLASGEVLARLVALVAEKTGYPADALDPNLDLEADLGIDTVKQAELFGEMRALYALPRDESVKIKDLNTLAKLAAYVEGKQRGDAAPAPAAVPVAAPGAPPAPVAAAELPAPVPVATTVPVTPPPAPPAGPVQAPAAAPADVLAKLTALVAEKTGYPTETLDPTLDLEADLGIDTVKQAELFGEMRALYGLPRDDTVKIKDLNTLAKIAAYVDARRTGAAPAVVASQAVGAAPGSALLPRAAVAVPLGPPAGAAWSPRGKRVLVSPGPLHDAVAGLLAGEGATLVRELPADAVVWQQDAATLFELARTKGPFRLVSVTHLGGDHAATRALGEPAQGALTGLTKGLAREWPEHGVVALDLDPHDALDARARAVVEELARADTVEVGRRAGARTTLRLAPVPPSPSPLPPAVVAVATGGAQGIAAACLLGLAKRTRLSAVLLGRTALGPDASAHAALDDAGWNRLRAATMEAMKARGERVTPVAVEKALAPLRKGAEIQRTLDAMKAAGADAVYVTGDAADPKALELAVATTRSRFGQVGLVLHAAGVEESKKLADKDAGAWQRTYAAKVDGATALLALTPGAKAILFGSVAGRFGNAAQADYSAANDALTKLAAHERAKGRDVRVLAWGPWGETGMATRGSTLTVLKAAGVAPIPTADGVAAFLAELAGPGRAETVLAGDLGLLEDAVRSPHAGSRSGGVEGVNPQPSAAAALSSPTGGDAPRPGGAAQRPFDGALDPAQEPWLTDHAVDGVPYLPGVHGLAWFGDAAPGAALENVRFGYPVKFLRNRPRTMHVLRDGASLRLLADGPQGPKEHFSAVAASSSPPPAPAPLPDVHGAVDHAVTPGHGESPKPAGFVDRAAIYARYFHGPRFQVLASARVGARGVVADGATPSASAARNLDLEAGLQTAGMHALAVAGAMALPHAIARVERWSEHAPGALEVRATFRGVRPEGPTNVWTYDVEAVVRDGPRVAATEGRGVTVAGGKVAYRLTGLELIAIGEGASLPADPVPVRWLKVGEGNVAEVRVGADVDDVLPLLTPAEAAQARGYAVEKRRKEWLAGTLAAKAALRKAEGPVAWSKIEVLNHADGYRTVTGAKHQVSVGHAGGVAVAVAFEPHEAVGVDVEVVEARPDAWRAEAFHPTERAALRTPEDETRAWAAKEAYLKAIRRGLAEDLHHVRVRLDGDRATYDLDGTLKARGAGACRLISDAGRVVAVCALATSGR